MKTADEFHPGDQTATGYGDVGGIGTGGGLEPADESAFDEDPSADEVTEGDTDIYANPALELDSDSPATDGVDG